MRTSAFKKTTTLGILALTFSTWALGQAGPPAPSSLEDIRGCTLDGDTVFIVTGRDPTATRRYKYSWDASIDALCNARGFAIGTPARSTGGPTPAPPVAAPVSAPTAPVPAPAVPGAAPRDFPPEAVPVSIDALKQKVTGKVFVVQLHTGARWRLDYKSNGYLFVNVAGGPSVSGPWRAEESRLCSQMRGSAESCNEVREVGPRLYLKRDNGDVIGLDPS